MEEKFLKKSLGGICFFPFWPSFYFELCYIYILLLFYQEEKQKYVSDSQEDKAALLIQSKKSALQQGKK